MKFDVAPLFPLPDGSPSTEAAAAGHGCSAGPSTSTGKANTFKEEQLDDRSGEFPRFDERFCMSDYRHGWIVAGNVTDPKSGEPRSGRLVHYDLKTGKSTAWTRRQGRPLRRADLRAASRGRRRGRRLGAERRSIAARRSAQRPRGVRGDRHRQGPDRAGPSQEPRAGGLPRQLAAGYALTMITVHHLNNSRSQRILWMLEELGLDYEVKRYQREPSMQAPAVAAGRASARQVAGDHRRRQDAGRIGRDPRVPGRDLRQRPARRRRRHAGAAALHLLPALRRRLADAASVHEAGVRPHARAPAVAACGRWRA